MAAQPLQLDDLLAQMNADAQGLVITPHNRAAASLRHEYDAAQQAAGKTIWQPPNVLSWDQFLSSLWTRLLLDGHDDRLLLNSAQEHLVWRDVISADHSTTTLTPVDSLATLSAQAWSLATAYRASSRLRQTASSEDARTFASWAEEFQRRCGRDRLISSASLEGALEDHCGAGRVNVPFSSVLFCGFTALTPSQRSLLAAFQDANLRVEFASLAAPQPAAASTILPDEASEARYAVRYLRDFLQRNPDGNAALLVPSLEEERVNLEPLLRELLAAELEDVTRDTSGVPWEFTAAPPLSDTPMVNVLVEMLRWMRGRLPLDQISTLLLSPYFATGVDVSARARFDAGTVQRQLLLRPELDLRTVLHLAREKAAELAPWLSQLHDTSLRLATEPPRSSYAEWGEFVREVMRIAGWPTGRMLNPREHETSLAFDSVLDLLATLDFAGKKITFPEALDALERQLALTPTPVLASGARLLVTTPSAAAGMVFSAAAFLRATDANLPTLARPNPLLDWTLQRNFAMPGTLPEQMHAEALAELQAMLQATGNLLFTSAAHSEAGALRPSALLAEAGVPSRPAQLPAEEHSAVVPLDVVEDDSPLPALPSTSISGAGARLLQLQAACGFLAFAEMRLGGHELESRDAGLDARESGNVLHRALQRFWDAVEDQATLSRYTIAEREEAVRHAVDGAFHRDLRASSTWDTAYIDVQKRRLHSLLMDWIEFELQRGPFTVIAHESKQTVEVGPLSLTVRLDRIDRTADNGFVYVDYKTGATARPSNWEGDRPDEPQLPLYTLLADPEELRGIAFAKIRAGKDMQWSGWTTDESIFPRKGSKRVELHEEMEGWRNTLTRLAENFAEGRTEVQPKKYAVNCKRCAQRLLCRLDLASLLSEGDEDESEGGE